MEFNIDMENHNSELRLQIQELKGEFETLHKTFNKVFQLIYMDNWLMEFEKLLLDNALIKVQNQTLDDKNSKWKEWWHIMQKIIEEKIQESLEIAHVDNNAYLNELVTYQLHF
jgi:hypothetical protein